MSGEGQTKGKPTKTKPVEPVVLDRNYRDSRKYKRKEADQSTLTGHGSGLPILVVIPQETIGGSTDTKIEIRNLGKHGFSVSMTNSHIGKDDKFSVRVEDLAGIMLPDGTCLNIDQVSRYLDQKRETLILSQTHPYTDGSGQEFKLFSTDKKGVNLSRVAYNNDQNFYDQSNVDLTLKASRLTNAAMDAFMVGPGSDSDERAIDFPGNQVDPKERSRLQEEFQTHANVVNSVEDNIKRTIKDHPNWTGGQVAQSLVKSTKNILTISGSGPPR